MDIVLTAAAELAEPYRLLMLMAGVFAGLIIGVMMLVWEHFDRWDYRRLGN